MTEVGLQRITKTEATGMTAWRDIDNDRRRFGLTVHLHGCSIDLGRRSYRIRWSVR